MHALTGFQRDLLYAVAGLGAPKGVDIKAELDEYYPAEVIHGRLYIILDQLVEKGLIEKGKKDGPTNEYRITKDGQREIETRREWEGRFVLAQ